MHKELIPKSQVPIKDISAVMCNYARPNSARDCVKRLKELGISEIIVWNNGSKPIPEATQNIIMSTNKGPIGKYLAATKTEKHYVLIVDDDHLLTSAGLTALRTWSMVYPAVSQNGSVFLPPFQDYQQRKVIRSTKIGHPQKVDMVQPNMGLMMKTEIYRKIPEHWAWVSHTVMERRPGIFSTDLEISCAIWDLVKQHPVVVPTISPGYEIIPDEAPDKALMNQAGIGKVKTKILRWLIAHGWKMLKQKSLNPEATENPFL